jgi:hypothetical protein
MALSGMQGKIYYSNVPIVPPDDWTPPAGVSLTTPATRWHDEITGFSLDDSGASGTYVHDKSGGWYDNWVGARGLDISISAKQRPQGSVLSPLYFGKVVWLQLYPAGTVGVCEDMVAQGYATVTRISYQYNMEGEPIAYTATLRSKGPWNGLPPGNYLFDANPPIGGFEWGCNAQA